MLWGCGQVYPERDEQLETGSPLVFLHIVVPSSRWCAAASALVARCSVTSSQWHVQHAGPAPGWPAPEAMESLGGPRFPRYGHILAQQLGALMLPDAGLLGLADPSADYTQLAGTPGVAHNSP